MTMPERGSTPRQALADAVDRALAAISVAVASIAIVAIFAALMADVIVRYVTPRGLGWAAEVPNLLFSWLIMGGVLLAAQRGSHIAVPILLNALGVRAARVLLIVIHGATIATFALLAIASMRVLAVTADQVFPITGVPMVYAYAAMPFGFVGIVLVSAVAIARALVADDPRDARLPGEEPVR